MKLQRGILAALVAVSAQASAQASAQTLEQDSLLLQPVQLYLYAQHDFDPAAIDAVVTRDFYEVSPLGEVDPREKVLGFYAPAKKQKAPEMKMSEQSIHNFGNAGTVLAKLSFATPNGETRSIRVGYVLVKEGEQWKLASAQYTGIRPPKAP